MFQKGQPEKGGN